MTVLACRTAVPIPLRFAFGFLVALPLASPVLSGSAPAAPPNARRPPPLFGHPLRLDRSGHLLPWNDADLGRAYDRIIRSTWRFWDQMQPDRNGLPYYMNHQVWTAQSDDHRGLGGDQIAMALSSWQLLYGYMGDISNPRLDRNSRDRIVEDMRFMADWVLEHGLSDAGAAWPRLPFPYNTLVYSGRYDGDMVLGKGFTQPDKAGSFARELVTLFKITGQIRYLEAAIDIADTLAAHTRPGDADRSPLPFKVHAQTGVVGELLGGPPGARSSYTTNWSGTLELFEALTALATGADRNATLLDGRTRAYASAHAAITAWMESFPLKTQRWGPFFEDIPGWSDTQINAVTYASYLMEHRSAHPRWAEQARSALDWARRELGNAQWASLGVLAINEQTAYRVPGNSHTARQAAAELRYAELTGDAARVDEAIRSLSWATYTVDETGRNQYPFDDVWLTDGYGDYVRHYLRALAAAPALAPSDQNHLLRSSSVIVRMRYTAARITYSTFDRDAVELFALLKPPRKVLLGLNQSDDSPPEARLIEQLGAPPEVSPGVEPTGEPGWWWLPRGRGTGGWLRVVHKGQRDITLLF